MSDDQEFDGSTVLVTGTARGIGRSCANAFTERGATVVGGDIRDQSETATLCESGPGRFQAVEADVTDTNDAETLVTTAEEMGGVDVLVNNAGIIPDPEPFGSVPDAQWERTIDVNLSGGFRVLRPAVESLREAGGSVVNVSSIYGQIGRAERVEYAASKAGVEGFTRSLAAELGPAGVRVNAVAPGIVRTPMNEQGLQKEEYVREFEASTALERLGEPEEVASAVVFLASESASYVTGETLLVDGGRAFCE